jgi:hypothetical protein
MNEVRHLLRIMVKGEAVVAAEPMPAAA